MVWVALLLCKKYKFSGKHPSTKEKLSWMKLKDYYLQSTTSSEVSV